ncbi:hypothetical protein K469DRAFT_703771 [Zopfia rhizophila CBS 207.26]|uniref:Uncharacterized protein n=1 Tax=Zopfia rhizophila CBS 207.26 TaxID=1314779 RepID=A0A6A6ECI1_9PEZI|nr:hypothetical protein K469DRAFT_703771 [Zopfia rhizophila CBS 207.26]
MSEGQVQMKTFVRQCRVAVSGVLPCADFARCANGFRFRASEEEKRSAKTRQNIIARRDRARDEKVSQSVV